MSPILALDCETAPPVLSPEEMAALKIDRRLKDPAKVEAARDAAWRKTSLHPYKARVLCVGFALDDDAPTVTDLPGFAAALLDLPRRLTVVGHNIDAFDLPILWANLWREGSPACRDAARIVGGWLKGKAWDRPTVDTMTAMTLWSPYGKVAPSLDLLCSVLGIPSPKSDIDGSQVLDVWLSGEEGQQRVRDYCARDVEAARAVYYHLQMAGRL